MLAGHTRLKISAYSSDSRLRPILSPTNLPVALLLILLITLGFCWSFYLILKAGLALLHRPRPEKIGTSPSKEAKHVGSPLRSLIR